MNARSMIVWLICATALSLGLAAAAWASNSADRPAELLNHELPLAHSSGTADGTDISEPHRGGWSHFVRWAGHFHPPLTAFPIALVLAAAFAELLRLITGAAWLDGATRWCILLGGISAAVVVPLGWAFALDHAGSWVLETHRWLGTAAGAGAILLLILSEISRRPERTGWIRPFRVLLFLAVPLVIATGFFGGAMMYGLHAYNWNSPDNTPETTAPSPR